MRGQHARCDGGARARLADGHHRLAVRELPGELAHEAIGDVPALRDVALVPFVLLADVDDLDGVVGDQPLELVQRDRLESLSGLDVDEVAGEVEQTDRA